MIELTKVKKYTLFIFILFIAVLLILVFMNKTKSIDSKIILADNTIISKVDLKLITNYFKESGIYTNNQIEQLIISDIGIGDYYNIKDSQRYKVELTGYVAETITFIFTKTNEDSLKLCRLISPLDVINYEV